MNYKEAYNKIIAAYFADKIKPYDSDYCFCGTLVNDFKPMKRNQTWNYFIFSIHGYLPDDFRKMEKALLETIRDETVGKICDMYGYDTVKDIGRRDEILTHLDYENALFNGMAAALEVLKQIHISRGERIEEDLIFTKRSFY